MPLNVTAAIVLKKIRQREKIQETIKLWPGVAEELLASHADRYRLELSARAPADSTAVAFGDYQWRRSAERRPADRGR